MTKTLIAVLILIGTYSNAQSSYFPLTPGTTLSYAFGSEIYGGTPYENYKSEVTIAETTETIDGKEYFISENRTGNTKGDQTVIRTYFRYRTDGSLVSKTDKTTEEIVVMNSTPKVGDTHSSQNNGITKVIDLKGTIKTPISTYSDCLVIEIIENQTTLRSYYKKNIGMIATTMVKDEKEMFFIYLE